MAFSGFVNPSMASPLGVPGGGVQIGPDLEDIQTESVGFLAIAGDAKLQLLPTPWPANQLPPPTASLMSIASHKQLLAAGGPDAVVIATTPSIRMAFAQEKPVGSKFQPIQPRLIVPMSMRISQLTFSADENYLVISAESGGGLAVYEVEALLKGSTQSAFELSTNGEALRTLLPNPTPETAELLAVVTVTGNLMMANLKTRRFVPSPDGQVLRTGVSCVSWSARGKQLVAGLGDGSAHQMTPEGAGKADIPKPPNMNDNEHVSSIFWLENNVFLMVHTAAAVGNALPPESSFRIVTRDPTNTFTFQKIADPVGAFGLATRSTPHHFILRLKNFEPDLQDMIVITSTASTDVGLFTRSKVPLSGAKKIKDAFTLTEMSDDSRRAQLPMAAGFIDTSPIGMAFDLSSQENVLNPIPNDSDITESPSPLPLLTALNNEGVLAAWWVVYNESIKNGNRYHGLVSANPSQPTQASSTLTQTPSSKFDTPRTAPAFGAPSTTSPFGMPSAPAFGSPSAPGAFGTPSAPGAFGTPSGLGQKQSVWGAPVNLNPNQTVGVKFGAPSFGSAAAAQKTPALGGSAVPGNQTSWAGGLNSNPAFGQSVAFGQPSQPFGTSASTTRGVPFTPGGFASFASGGGFTTATSSSGESIFGAKALPSLFNSSPQNSSIAMGSATNDENMGEVKPFGSSSFVLGSTFKADQSSRDEGATSSTNSKSLLMGGNFLNTLGDTTKSTWTTAPLPNETDMDTEDDAVKAVEPSRTFSTTPAPAATVPKFSLSNSGSSTSGDLFGMSETVNSKPVAGFSFGQLITEKSIPPRLPLGDLPGVPSANSSLVPKTPTTVNNQPILNTTQMPASTEDNKNHPSNDSSVMTDIPAAPLPPGPTSKDPYAASDTLNSLAGKKPSLSPEFVSKMPVLNTPRRLSVSPPKLSAKTLIAADMLPPLEVPGGPSSDESNSNDLSDEEGLFGDEVGDDHSAGGSDEGSGEDVTKSLSPTSDAHQTPTVTPENSFDRQRAPAPNNFFKAPQGSKPLFGEVQRFVPVLAPPKISASPRSPSPVRSAVPGRVLRPETLRSVSAPGIASQLLNKTASSSVLSHPTILSSKGEENRRAELRAQKEAEEELRLVDDEDEVIQQKLSSDLEAQKDLAEFVAHTDYVSAQTAESIPRQVETVYRDINSMIDTLGLNARSMQNFMKYQTEEYNEGGRSREDLENDDDWCLVEIEALSSLIVNDLARQLEGGRVTNLAEKFQTCKDLHREVHKLRAKHEGIKTTIDSHLDGSQDEMARLQPLGVQQATQQGDLRRNFMKFQSLLSKAEEDLATLKVNIASRSAASGKSKGTEDVTVEAVMRTISKMTSMAEKRSGDIDVLEGQIRKMRFDSTLSVGSREGSPLATPQKKRASVYKGTSSTSRFYTPDSIKDPRKTLRNSFMSSVGSHSFASPPRKRVGSFTANEKTQVKAKMERRKEVTDRLKRALAKSGTSVRLMNDD